MDNNKIGKITEVGANAFKVFFNGKFFDAKAKGNIKIDGKIVLGDNVFLELEPEPLITAICPRKNLLFKPTFANVDCCLLILAPIPQPNYKLVDIILALCFKQKIKPIICLNKCDLDFESTLLKIKNMYSNVCEIFTVSAKDKIGLDELTKQLANTTAVCGQSAVGKSSLLNALFNLDLKTGTLSEKISRGKNTTVKSYFYITKEGQFIIDTPGFSFLDLEKIDITKSEFVNLYPDFKNYNCKYRNCCHQNIDGCEILQAVNNGEIDKTRLDNFIEIYNNLKSNLKDEIKNVRTKKVKPSTSNKKERK